MDNMTVDRNDSTSFCNFDFLFFVISSIHPLSFRGIRLCRMTRNLIFHSTERFLTSVRNDIGRGSLRSIRNNLMYACSVWTICRLIGMTVLPFAISTFTTLPFWLLLFVISSEREKSSSE